MTDNPDYDQIVKQHEIAVKLANQFKNILSSVSFDIGNGIEKVAGVSLVALWQGMGHTGTPQAAFKLGSQWYKVDVMPIATPSELMTKEEWRQHWKTWGVEEKDIRLLEEDKIIDKIRYIREKLELTQDQLAERSGLPQSHISRIENGHLCPSRKTLAKIAKGLEVETAELDVLRFREDRKPEELEADEEIPEEDDSLVKAATNLAAELDKIDEKSSFD